MNRSACCLCRCRQLLLTRPRSQLRPRYLRRLSISICRLFSTRQLHTNAPTSSAAPSLRPAHDEHIEPELSPSAATSTSAVDVAARIHWLLSARHELDAVVLFQRNRHQLPLSVWNAVLSTLIHQPRLLSHIHQPPPLLATGRQQQPSLLSSLDVFLSALHTRSLRPDGTTYQLCMDVAASAGDWQRVLHWWHEMDTAGMRPTTTVAHHIMTAMTETGQSSLIKPFYLAHFTSAQPTTAITPADTSQPPPLRPTALTYHYLLSAAIQLRDTDVTKQWKAMKAKLPLSALNITLHTSYLAYLGGEGKLDEMMKEYTELKRKAVRPTLLLLSTVITPLSSEIIALSSPLSASAATSLDSLSGRLGKLLSSFHTVLEDLTLHSALSSNVQHNHNHSSDAGAVDTSTSARLTVATPLLNPSLYALIIATFSSLRDTHRTLRYYQQYCEYCVSVLSSTASSSAIPSLASPSFSSSTHSAILHSMIRLYALQGDVGMMEGYLGEIVSGGLENRETMESVLVGYMRADVPERVMAVYTKWHALAGGAAMNGQLKDELVRYYVRKGRTAALEQLMNDGVVAADVEGYGKLIEACCLSTDAFDAMWSYHETMKAAHSLPASATYAQMLRAVHERGSVHDKQRAMQLIAEIGEGNVRLTDDAIVHTLLIAVQAGAIDGKQHKNHLYATKSRLNRGGSSVRTTHIHALLTALPVTERLVAWEWARVALSKQTGDNYELMLRTYEEQKSRGEISEAKLAWRWKDEWNDVVQRRVLPTPSLLRLHLARQLSAGGYGRFVAVYEQAMEVCQANFMGVTTEQVGELQVAAMEALADKATAGDATSLPASQLPLLLQSAATILRSIKFETLTPDSPPYDLKRIYSSLQSVLSHLRALLLLHTQQPVASLEPVHSMDSRFVRIQVQNEQRSAAQVDHSKKRGKKAPPVQRVGMRTPHPVDVLAGSAGRRQSAVRDSVCGARGGHTLLCGPARRYQSECAVAGWCMAADSRQSFA